jgi:hypothetical protein
MIYVCCSGSSFFFFTNLFTIHRSLSSYVPFLLNSLVIFSIVNSISFFFTLPLSHPFFSSLPQSSRVALSLSIPTRVNVCLQNLFPYCYSGNPPKFCRSTDRLDKSFLFLRPLPFSTSIHPLPHEYFSSVYYWMRLKKPSSL